MIEGSRKLPAQHITIRVPWHDNGWDGTVCRNPCGNTSCMILPRIGKSRDDTWEASVAGRSFDEIPNENLPPCVEEHASIMADHSLGLVKNHPYRNTTPDTHGHMAPTPYKIDAWSAAAVPFKWMLLESVQGKKANRYGPAKKGKAELLQLDFQLEREPEMDFKTSWLQEGTNQRVLLDTFFSAIEPGESLVFFYAKRTPMSEEAGRVIVGVGKVNRVGEPVEYRYEKGTPKSALTGYLWERNIEHSIRPESGDGFLLPYHELLELAEKDINIDLESCTASAPDEYFEQYSYGSELLPHDGAIASLLECERAIRAMREYLDAPWDNYLGWIDAELNRLWKTRGPFPGLGSALNAFGVPNGNLLAWHITAGNKDENTDPWSLVDRALEDPSGLPQYLQQGLGKTILDKWRKLPEERRALLKLLSRFNLSDDQVLRWYQPTVREEAGIEITDSDIIANSYLIFIRDRLQKDPVAFDIIDRGLFPPQTVRDRFPVPKPGRVSEAVDPRRVHAVMIDTLEAASLEGHTLLPESWLINRIRNRGMQPDCPIDADLLPLVDEYLAPEIEKLSLNSNGGAYQLGRYRETAEIIRSVVVKRIRGKKLPGNHDWSALVDAAIDLNKVKGGADSEESRARAEKQTALEMIYRSRISVLIGPAGTGKSTLLNALCRIKEVSDGNILLLAPTGKARVRLEQATGMYSAGKTIAQFLHGLKRYDGATGRYFVNPDAERRSGYKTVVIDECSMLTEEQLAAVLDALKGFERLVLIGDSRQLPPIGAGRPYVDIVERLKPDNIDSIFPRVTDSFAELTITRRQKGERDDVVLANYFSGRAIESGADEVWNRIENGQCANIKIRQWSHHDELQKLLINEIVDELKLESDQDEPGFERSLGGVVSEYNGKTNVFFNNKNKDKPGAAESAENWQVLSPIKPTEAGVIALNRIIHARFRQRFIELAGRTGRQQLKIPRPAGPESIIYGDKVINVINDGYRKTWPEKADSYIANGDIGIVTGHRRTKKRNFKPFEIEVEPASQPGFVYKYRPREFESQDASPPLELAYALTVHKTQGSEFGMTFLIIPNPCRILSREMLYTALTRHRERIVILHQGRFQKLRDFSHEENSEIARRMTNLFISSVPEEVVIRNRSIFLDKNLIYMTDRGDLVRSKSEWIIADKLHAAGIDYIYEQPVMLDGETRYPDFTIVDDDSGETWYWEHNGLMSNPEYRSRWERKLNAYRKAGIFPIDEGGGKNGILLMTEEHEGTGLDVSVIKKYIDIINGHQ